MELTVPSFGESITEVLISEWLVDEGGKVAQDANLVVIETDKITSEVPAPTDCVVKRILKAAGETATVGEAIAELEELPAGSVDAEPAPGGGNGGEAPAPEQSATRESSPEHEAPRTESAEAATIVMPAAARLAAESGVDASGVKGTGPGNRVLKEDVQRALEAPAPAAEVPAPAAPAGARAEERVRMTPLRKKVAQHLLEAQHNAALLTTFNEVDMSGVMALRKQVQEQFQAAHGVKLGIMSFFVKAAVEALKAFPAVNARIDGDEIVYRDYFDIGVAVGGGKGLVVPILRDAERLSFAGVEKAIGDFAARAKDNKLTLEELSGGTFSISNGGIYGNLLSTPIVNAPQSAILGLHAIQDRAVVVDGQIVVRPMMYIAMSYDHRLIDGREAVTFLRRIKSGVEDPTRILLEI
ncbi:MAG: 2-oxoglutarate dehydrogenase complex dihydrolipoyllysine-residue succinyltransferase [Candidatus Krumholzibacteriia bacterium]|nr:2-oxoglutarate dehydrogenase complex dihydrolipoyllysine-residue succinyltransferase [Candidatus Latescibacterota bacterium]